MTINFYLHQATNSARPWLSPELPGYFPFSLLADWIRSMWVFALSLVFISSYLYGFTPHLRFEFAKAAANSGEVQIYLETPSWGTNSLHPKLWISFFSLLLEPALDETTSQTSQRITIRPSQSIMTKSLPLTLPLVEGWHSSIEWPLFCGCAAYMVTNYNNSKRSIK